MWVRHMIYLEADRFSLMRPCLSKPALVCGMALLVTVPVMSC